MKTGYIYIVTNKTKSTLYIGVTSNLIARIYQHREGSIAGFTKCYQCKHLLYFEEYDDITEAILREKKLKNWKRAWKENLINSQNPAWKDLWEEIL